MRHLKTVLTVLGAVTVLVLASNTVVIAATGQGFILGKGNSANNITALKRTTSGSVLKLESASSTNPPMTVTGKGKVANLNADTIDGYDSTALRDRTYVWTKAVTSQSSVSFLVPLPAGTWEVAYSVYMSGGGGEGSSGCFLRKSVPSFTYYGEDRSATVPGASPGHSGSAVITVDADDELALVCTSPANWSTLANEPIQVYATPTTVIGGGALRQAPPAARVSR